jgi:hypothetical protein
MRSVCVMRRTLQRIACASIDAHIARAARAEKLAKFAAKKMCPWYLRDFDPDTIV